MLSLREQIRRHPSRSCKLIRNYHSLRWPGKPIDPDYAVDLSFRQRNEQITGTQYLVYWLDRLSSISQCCDRLCTAKWINLVHTGDGTSREDYGIDRRIFISQ